jgi:hypothetical protein
MSAAETPQSGSAGTDQGNHGIRSRAVPASWQATALDPSDNIAMVLEPVVAGQDVVVYVGGNTTTVRALEPIALGHKIALVDLDSGDSLVKYGECIGEATTAIARGAWVHIHNLRSRRARHDETNSVFDAHAYMDVAAAALGLSIPSASRDAVAANLSRLHALAQEVLKFEFPVPGSSSPDSSPSTMDPPSRSPKRQATTR